MATHGYSPKKKHLSIGVLTMKTQGINLHKYLEEYILMLKISNVLKAEKHGYVVPLNPKDKKFISGRIMLVGDAAGLVDPITEEGISNAIDSGRAAAGVIITGAFSQKKTMKIFIREMNKILSELKYAKILSLLVYNSPAIRSRVFKKYGKK